MIATTASHEAGHAFGLSHHKGLDASGNASDYDVGTYLTTPIMGSNTSSDRTIWSKNASQDTVQILTNTLGARPDDVGNNFLTASNLPLIPLSLGSGIALRGYALGSASGVIGTTSDADWFHVTSTGGAFKFDASPVANGNLDVKLDLYQRTIDSRLGIYFTLVATADPAIPSTQPFSGLNASISANLGSGDFYVVVRSHGSYGDLGQYTLTVSRSDVLIYQLPTTPILAQAIVPRAPDPGPLYVSSSLLQLSNVLGGGAGQVVPTAPPAPKATDLALADWGTPVKPVSKSAKLLATDQIFADWD